MTESDPSRIRSLAISREDLFDAFVYNRENPTTAVLRVTPPFHGRMRARLHVSNERATTNVWRDPVTGSIHFEPESLLEQEVVDAYPVLEEIYASMDESDRAGETVSDVHEQYDRRLEEWRKSARSRVLDEVKLEGDVELEGEVEGDVELEGDDAGNSHRIDLKWLG